MAWFQTCKLISLQSSFKRKIVQTTLKWARTTLLRVTSTSQRFHLIWSSSWKEENYKDLTIASWLRNLPNPTSTPEIFQAICMIQLISISQAAQHFQKSLVAKATNHCNNMIYRRASDCQTRPARRLEPTSMPHKRFLALVRCQILLRTVTLIWM